MKFIRSALFVLLATALSVVAPAAFAQSGSRTHKIALLSGKAGPSLDINFANYQNAPSTIPITYTGSGGTYYNSSGIVTAATTNVPRLTWNPATLAFQGMLVEQGTTNIRTQSAFASGWTLTNITQSASGTAPDNSTSPLFTSTVGTNIQAVQQNNTQNEGNATYATSVFLKPNGWRYVQVYQDNSVGNGVYINVDLQAGTVSAVTTNGTATAGSSGIQTLPNGWFRVWLTGALASGDTVMRMSIGLAPSGTPVWYPNVTGNGTSGVYVWGAQQEALGLATSYVPSGASQGVRTADVASTIIPFTSVGWTLVGKFLEFGNAALQFGANITDSATGNRAGLRLGYGPDGVIITSSVQRAPGLPGFYQTLGVPFRGALSYLPAFAFMSYGGISGANTTSAPAVVFPSSTSVINIGNVNGGNFLNGIVLRLSWYPYAMQPQQASSVTMAGSNY